MEIFKLGLIQKDSREISEYTYFFSSEEKAEEYLLNNYTRLFEERLSNIWYIDRIELDTQKTKLVSNGDIIFTHQEGDIYIVKEVILRLKTISGTFIDIHKSPSPFL